MSNKKDINLSTIKPQEKETMNKILITGSNGFLGSHLIDFCLSKQCEVYGLDRPSSSFRNLMHYFDGNAKKVSKRKFCNQKILIKTNHKNLLFLECDILDEKLLEKIILKIKPDYLFHLAAQPYVIQSWKDPVNTIRINVVGTINVFEPIKKHKIKTRVILACSATEFGTTAQIGRPLKENDPLLALHPYGISKIAAELLSRQYYLNFNIETINLRFFNLTGTRRKNDAPSDFIDAVSQIELGLKESKIEVGNLEPYRDFLDVSDAVEAIWLATTSGTPGETYHICSNQKTKINDLLELVLNFTDKEIKVIQSDTKLRATDEDIIIGDNSKISSELGWYPKKNLENTIEEMFEERLQYYKSLKQ